MTHKTVFMKRNPITIFSTLIALMVSPALIAQQWNGTTDIYNANSGNIGIGTSSPAAKLHVNGALRVDGAGTSQVQFTGNNPANPGFIFDGSTSNTEIYTLQSQNFHTSAAQGSFFNGHFIMLYNNVDLIAYQQPFSLIRNYPGLGNAGGLIIDNDQSGTVPAANSYKILSAKFSGTEVANIKGDGSSYFAGNMGLGIAPSNARLQVNGSFKLVDGTQGAGKILTSDANGLATWSAAPAASQWSGSGNNIFFNNGHVGLGTSSPAAKLHLYGTNPSLFIDGDQVSYYGGIRIKTMAGDGYIDNYGENSVYWGLNMKIKNNGTGNWSQIGITPSGAKAHTWEPGAIPFEIISAPSPQQDLFRVSKNVGVSVGSINPASVLVVDKNGNLGLGISNPTSRIEVDGDSYFSGKMKIATANFPTTGNYKLAVGGDIIAEKIRVKLQSSGWPDYVFNPQYPLLPLSEVEQFIKKNNHLPEVPSASEVGSNGLDLGDGQALLLKKIEELTLHMIEMNKTLETLQEENRMIRKQLKK